MLSPEMAGTVKLCDPELVPAGELAGGGVVVGYAELFECAEEVADGPAVAECVLDDEVCGAADDPDGAAEAEPPAPAVEAAEGVDPLDAHAVRPAPPMTAAMITAGTRHILML